jgi:thymidylate synthase (FAD)
MKIIKPDVFVINCQGLGIDALKNIENAGRTCYKSEDKITENSCQQFVQNMINRDHTAMLEFADATVRIICDRGVTHEIVRHRLFSFAQESTRYCNYAKRDDLGNELTFIEPCFWQGDADGLKHGAWRSAMALSEQYYLDLIAQGASPQEARSVLPNATETKIFVTANARALRNFIELRGSEYADVEIRKVAVLILEILKKESPNMFGDYALYGLKDGTMAVKTDYKKV